MSFGISAATIGAVAAVGGTAIAGYSAYSQNKAAKKANSQAAAASAEAAAAAGENYAASLYRADDYSDTVVDLFRDYEKFTAKQAARSKLDYNRAVDNSERDADRFLRASNSLVNNTINARDNYNDYVTDDFKSDYEISNNRSDALASRTSNMYEDVLNISKNEEKISNLQLDAAQQDAINLEQERYDIWADTYGSIEDNLSEYYNSITPAYYASVGLEQFKKEFERTTTTIKENFARKGINPRSGVINSVLAQAEISAAETRAGIRRDAGTKAAEEKSKFLELGIQRDSGDSFANTLNTISSQEQATDTLARTQTDAFRSDQLDDLNNAYLTRLDQTNQLVRDSNQYNTQEAQVLANLLYKGLDINQLDKQQLSKINELDIASKQNFAAIDNNNANAVRGDYSNFASNIAITAENNAGNIASGVVSAGNARTDSTSRAATAANNAANSAASNFGSSIQSTVSTLGNLYGDK